VRPRRAGEHEPGGGVVRGGRRWRATLAPRPLARRTQHRAGLARHGAGVRHARGSGTAALEVGHVKRWFLPYTPDVLALLLEQSDVTCDGITAFVRWSRGDLDQNKAVRRNEHDADAARRKL